MGPYPVQFGLTDSDIARFWPKVGPPNESGCRDWLRSTQGRVIGKRYGQFQLTISKGIYRPKHAHLVAWVINRGDFPRLLVPDHLCRRPICVESEHLEWITNSENIQRGFLAKNGDYCGNGLHRWDDQTPVMSEGRRRCRPCIQERDRLRGSNRQPS